MLNDHFWPSMYPGIIVGVLLGLAGGGVVSTLTGAAGGLGGAVVMYFVVGWLGLQDGVISLIALIGGAVAGAHVCMLATERLAHALGRRNT